MQAVQYFQSVLLPKAALLYTSSIVYTILAYHKEAQLCYALEYKSARK